MTAIGEAFKLLLRRAFDIREGEFLRATLMQLNIFLIICTLLIVKPAVNGLFLSKFGVENLPNVFVLVAIFAAVVTTFYSRILARVALNKIIVRTLGSSVLTLLVFGTLLRLNFLEGWVLYLFFIWVSIFAVLSASQFWILANVVFNSREAKRLFGFIGAGAIAGGIFGGYLTTLLAEAIGSENLLFVCAALLSCCIPITQSIWRKSVDRQTPFQQKKRLQGFSEHPFQLVRRSRHLTFLASIIWVSVIVAKLVDYQFSAVAAEAIPDPDELTAFFGFWFSSLNLLSLLVQLFLTSRVVGVFGVGTSLFFLPGGILFGAILLFFFPSLWAAVLIKVSDGSLKQSINKASVELLALPIPAEIKTQTKTFIDVFVDSIATGIGGLILIFLVSGLDLSIRAISVMIAGLIVLWIYLAVRIRREYLLSFRSRIDLPKEEQVQKMPDLSSESVLGGLTKVLTGGSEKQILWVLRKVRELHDERLFEPVHRLLAHPSGEVRAEALRNLYFFRTPDLSMEVRPMVNDPDQRVKVEAFEYLIAHSPEEEIASLMEHYLEDPDYRVSGAALVSLAVETRDNPLLRNAFDLNNHLLKKVEELPTIADEEQRRFQIVSILKAAGRGHAALFFPFIEECLSEDGHPEVRKTAILAAGETTNPRFVRRLIALLGAEPDRQSAQTALLSYGPEIVEVLATLIYKPETSPEMARAIPAIVYRINSQRSVDFLFELMDFEDVTVRLEALRSLNRLQRDFPHLKFNKKHIFQRILDEARLFLDTLSILYAQMRMEPLAADRRDEQREARQSLINLLERRLDGNLERIFRLLGLKYPPDDIRNIYRSLQSNKPDLRSNAIEYLDNLLEPNLKRVLIPIVETAMLDAVSDEAIRNLNLRIPGELECYAMLLNGKDLRIKLAVLHLIGQLKDARYKPLIDKCLQSENVKVRTFAAKAAEGLA